MDTSGSIIEKLMNAIVIKITLSILLIAIHARAQSLSFTDSRGETFNGHVSPRARAGSVPHIIIFSGKPYEWMPLSLPKFWVFP
jgi:hypothetical protein